MAAARNVRSKSIFTDNPMAPLAGQDFLDFFGQGERSPRPGKTTATRGNVPEALQRYAPAFIPKEVQVPIFRQENVPGDYDQPVSTRSVATGQTRTEFEHPNEVATRMGGRNRLDTPVWKQAYDAALIEFNRDKKARQDEETKRKRQRDERKEREDAPGAGGFARANAGTSLITSAQGFLGGQGGAASLLK